MVHSCQRKDIDALLSHPFRNLVFICRFLLEQIAFRFLSDILALGWSDVEVSQIITSFIDWVGLNLVNDLELGGAAKRQIVVRIIP